MAVVGIDFGTLNCVISQAKRGGIETTLNEASKRATPALVSFSGKQRSMGVAASSVASSNWKNTVQTVKRFVGRSWSDAGVQADIKRCPNAAAFVETDGDRIGITVDFNDQKLVLSPEDVCAMLIGSLKTTAEYANEGRAVGDLVFSVPSFWMDRQRRAFLDAAKIAGVNVLGLINDGTATALSYGIWKSASNQFSLDEAEIHMFVDIGHASMQVTIAAFFQGRLQVLAASAEEDLGGRDIDWALAKHFAEEFKEKFKADPMENPKAVIKLLAAASKAKSTLTPEGVAFANVNVEFLLNEQDYNSKLTIETFNELIQPVVDRVAGPIEQAMEDAKLSLTDIKSVEIVGGSTRVRAIKKRIGEVMELDDSKLNYGLSTTLNADEAISRGCALQSAMLSPAFRVKEFRVSDCVVAPITVAWDAAPTSVDGADDGADEDAEDDGAGAAGQNSIVILSKGNETPNTKRITFRRAQPFEVRASYEEAPEGKRELATFKIGGLPADATDPACKIRVDFKQDLFGLFDVVNASFLAPLPEEDEAKSGDAEAAADGEAKAADGEAKAADGEAKTDGAEAKSSDAEAKAADGEETKKKKKKKFKATRLTVESIFAHGMTASDVANSQGREQEFMAQDKLLKETGEAKNSLEAYIYSFRDKISGPLREFSTDDERAEFSAALDKEEDWIYDEGYDETKAVYVEHLAALKKMGDKFVDRSAEAEGRPAAVERLRSAMSDNLAVANSPDEKYAHIDDDDRDKVRKACEDAEEWLKSTSDEQASKNLYEDPVLRIGDIEAKIIELNNMCRPIVTKRKPPAPAPKKKDDEKKKDDDAKPMETDGDDAEAGAEADADGDAEAGADAGDAGEGKDQENGMDVD